MDYIFDQKPNPEDLTHFGTKGMKWGVRRENRLNRAKRVASGKATVGEKARFTLTETSAVSVARNKGLTGAAKSRVRELEVRKARIKTGKATARDLIALHGGDKLFITGRA
ncbi:MAG: hypothetical protein H0U49_05755 [Parachlamydiaceae bacterium]|nr:hypothetical protein [Parachlamydiaceae bacterium]